jgi:hypothetical protein
MGVEERLEFLGSARRAWRGSGRNNGAPVEFELGALLCSPPFGSARVAYRPPASPRGGSSCTGDPMPTIDLTDEEHAAVKAAIRRAVEDDKFPHAPRLDPLRAALAKLDKAAEPERQPPPKAMPPARGKKAAAARRLTET